MGNELSKERIGRITGSRIGAVLGLDGAFKSRNAILQEMVREFYGELEQESNPDLQRGIELEPLILKQEIKGYKTSGFIKHKKYDFLGATPDAWFMNNAGEKVCVEVKAPRSFKELSPSYNAQMQLEMEVLDADVGLFTQGVMVGDKLKVFSTLVNRDKEFIERNLEALKKFMDDYERAKNNHFDLELEVLSKEYVTLSKQVKEIQGKLSALKGQLIARGSFENAFVSVIEKTRRGGFDFAKYCMDNKVQMTTEYLKADTTFYEVRIHE